MNYSQQLHITVLVEHVPDLLRQAAWTFCIKLLIENQQYPILVAMCNRVKLVYILGLWLVWSNNSDSLKNKSYGW